MITNIISTERLLNNSLQMCFIILFLLFLINLELKLLLNKMHIVNDSFNFSL